MHTKVFDKFKVSVSQLLGHINALDLYLQISRERIDEWKQEKGEQAEQITLKIPGISPDEIKEYQELFGVITLKLSEADGLISFVMLTACKNALVSLIAVTEVYLQELFEWMFETKPDIFKSSKELKLTHKEIIEIGDYQAILAIVRDKIISDLTRDNIADSFEELFAKKCGWDINGLKSNLTLLKDISAMRNIIIHNQSRVNQIFLSIIAEPNKYSIDQEIIISPQKLKKFAYNTVNLISELDNIAFSKCHA